MITNSIFLGFFGKKYINKINNRNNINETYNKNFEKFESLQKKVINYKIGYIRKKRG
jgi:hypothetical protein